MEEPISTTYKIVENYTKELKKSFTKMIKAFEPKDHKDIEKFVEVKTKLIGPALFSLKMHIAELSSITKNVIPNFSKWSDLLNDITSFTQSSKIEASHSMADFWELDFSMGIDEMFCGNMYQNESFGVWTDGKEIYKGEFSNKEKHGYGFQIFNDGSIFEGKFKRGHPESGKWKLETGENFYGRFNKEENWMIGIKEKDNKPGVGELAKNYLYYKGEKTILKNIFPVQDIDIESLKGINGEPCVVKWLDGVSYEGYWEDFFPISGVFTIDTEADNEDLEGKEGEPKKKISKEKKIRIFGNNGSILPIQNISPKEVPRNNTQNRPVKIEFLNGAHYEGEIDRDMEISGFGIFTDQRKQKTCGIFSSSVSTHKFKIDDDEITKKFIESQPIEFFRNSKEYLEMKDDMDEIPTLKVVNPVYTRETNFREYWYKGHWKDYMYVDGLCEVKIGEKKYTGYCDEGIILSVSNMRASELFGLGIKSGLASGPGSGKKAVFLDLEYLDEKKFSGQIDIERFIVGGYGCVSFPDGKKVQGFWEDDKCVVEFKEIDGKEDADFRCLEDGTHKIKLKNDLEVEVTFEHFEVKEGYYLVKGTKEPFHGFQRHEEYYDNNAKKYDFKLILVLHSPIETIRKSEHDNILRKNITQTEINFLREYSIVEREKFTGLVYKKDRRSMKRKKSLIGSDFILSKKQVRMAPRARPRGQGFFGVGRRNRVEMMKQPIGEEDDKILKINLEEEIMYDERNLDSQTKSSLEHNVKKFCEASYFKNSSYQNIETELEDGIGYGNKIEVKLDKELLELKPQKSYIQITNSGMFKTHSDLFNYLAEEKEAKRKNNFRGSPMFNSMPNKDNLKFLEKNEKLKFALYELNKLNGIAEVNQNSIKFYNGNEYVFQNGERSFEKSLGSIVKFQEKDMLGTVQKQTQHYYWKRFFNESLINNFDEKFFEEEIKGKLDSTCLKRGNRTMLKFNKGIKLDSAWSNFTIMGNSTYTNSKNETIKRPIYDYGAISKKTGGSALYELISPKLIGGEGMDSLTLFFSPLSCKMKLFPRGHLSSFSSKWVKGNSFKKLKMHPSEAFSIRLDKKAEQGFLEIIMAAANSRGKTNQLKPIELKYPNGDYFKGYCTANFSKDGEGLYNWSEGFSYQGKFFANNTFGWGQYKDCLGVVRKGYYYRGFLLQSDYGLEKLKSHLKMNYSSEGFLTVNNEDLRLLTDSDLIIGSQMFLDCPIQFRKIYTDIEKSRKIFMNDLNNIKEGELDYTHSWGDKALLSITSLVLKTKIKKAGNILNLNDNLTKMSLNLQKITRKKEEEIQKQIEDRSLGRTSQKEKLIDFEFIEKKKIENKYNWIYKADLKKLKHFEKESIIEMVKDEDLIGINKLFKRYSKAKLVKTFLKIKDSKSRNILMISAFYGRRQIFIDFLSVMIQSAKEGSLSKKDIKKILLQRDYEGNNTVDLLSIQGFDGTDEPTVSKKLPSNIQWEENIFKETNAVKLKTKSYAVESNQVYNSIIDMLKNIERKLFTQNFMTFERLEKYVNSIRPSDKTSDLIFLSKRTICLFALFETVKKIGDIDLLPQKVYDEKRSNPTHFTLFHGDLHATIQILKYKFDILLWRNSEGELPPQVIKWSGVNYYQAKAVFASILREFTRNFNLKVINELLLADDRILKAQKEKSIHKFEVEEKEEKERVEKMKAMLEEKNFFDPENVYLYCNNYVLFSNELSKQYVNFIKEKSRFRQSKTDHRVQKKFTFVQNSELESLQKNFLDYYQGTFIGYHDKKIEEYYRETVQEILTWYAYIYGDAEINPQIYTLLDIDPFERILDGRNIFHFMCQNNSYCLLEDFIDYLYEKCHKRPFDPSKDDYREWDREIDREKLNELRGKLMYQTKTNQNTPAHLCAINQSEECLDLLVKYNVDLEAINLRGRTVTEILEKSFKEDYVEMKQFTPTDISFQVLEYIKNQIISCCKQHSMKYKYLENVKDRHDGLKKIFSNSVFSLTKDLSKNRDSILRDTEDMLKGKIDSQQKLLLYAFFILIINKINKIDSKKKQDFKNKVLDKLEKITKLGPENIDNKTLDMRDIIGFVDQTMSYDQTVTLLRSFIYHFNKGIQISTQSYLKLLFDFRVLQNLENFKYKKFEKMTKKKLLKKLSKFSLLNPLTTDIKNNLSLDRLLCIEVRNKESDYIQSHPVVVQLNNLKKKYTEYSGGFIIDIIRGYPVKVNKEITWYNPVTWFNLCCNKDTEIKWFILLKASRELLEKVATDDQMKTYNMKQEFHTLFYKNPVNPEELEPLRHFQKMKILMKLVNEEFNIENFKKDGIVKSYFPIHNYTKRKALEKIWSKNKFTTHFFDIFVSKTRDTTLQIFSLIAFYHGIQQGFYFGFLSLYNNSLFLLAFIGVIGTYLQYVSKVNRDFVIFSTALIVGAWSALFVNTWKRREKELAYSFDTYEDDNIKQERDEYKGEYTIDQGTLKIQKKREILYLRQFIFTVVWFTIGVTCTVLIYLLINSLNNSPLVKENQNGTIVTGILNGTLNFIVSLVYGIGVNILVKWENHVYEEKMRKSFILKSQIFGVFSQIFTLVVQSIFIVKTDETESDAVEYSKFTTQILSNLVTSAILNYGLSVGLPIFLYLKQRYYFISYILMCKWLCCKKKRGKLDDFRERTIVKMLASRVGRVAFLRYCTKDGKITEEMKEKVENYTKNKIKSEEMKSEKEPRNKEYVPLKTLKHSSTQDLEKKMYKGDEYHIPSPSGFSEKETNQILKDLVEKADVDKSYKGKAEILGINRKKNIGLRLKEEFANFVLGREQTIESSYMIDLGTLEIGFYSSLLSQFTFICFFSQFLISAGLVSYIINLLIIFLTIRIYTRVSRRTVSRKVKNIGVWTKLFDLVSYLGIVYNTVIAVKYAKGLTAFTGKDVEDSNEVYETELIYRVQFGLLIFKFLFSILVPTLPNWIKQRISRENLVLGRNSKKLTKTLNRFKKEFKNYEEMFEDEDSAGLKYFFKNEDPVQEFEVPQSIIKKVAGNNNFRNQRAMIVVKAKKKLL